MANFQTKLNEIATMTGFEGLDYTLFRTKSGNFQIAVVEYWLEEAA